MDNQNLIIGVVGAVVLGAAVYFGTKPESKPKTAEEKEADKIQGEDKKTIIPKIVRNENFPLKEGSYGPKVSILQTKLSEKNKALSIDGDFGSRTKNELMAQYGISEISEARYNEITAAVKAKIESTPVDSIEQMAIRMHKELTGFLIIRDDTDYLKAFNMPYADLIKLKTLYEKNSFRPLMIDLNLIMFKTKSMKSLAVRLYNIQNQL